MRPILALAIMLVAVVGLGALALNYTRRGEPVAPPLLTPTSTSAPLLRATPQEQSPGGLTGPPIPLTTTVAATPTVETQGGVLLLSEQALLTLESTDVPGRDLYSLTARLRLKTNAPIPRTTGKPPGDFEVGHKDVFYLSDLVQKTYYTTTATVRERTAHAYWYVQDGTPLDEGALREVAGAFEEQIYPTNRRLFGSEWTPGVDNDPRITVLFAHLAGAGGYYSSADEYTRLVNPYSNEREIIYINTSNGWYGVASTLAHEFQHMVHWNEHPSHDVWLNEGAAVLASALNGYSTQGVEGAFLSQPDVQLNSWGEVPSVSIANYGASFLFFDFLHAHYGGEKLLRAVISSPGSGVDPISQALSSAGYSESFEDVAQNWMLANLLDGQQGAAERGLDYPDREVSVSPHALLSGYPKARSDTVSQFGADYIQMLPPSSGGTLQLEFVGDAEIPIIPTEPPSGTHFWWSNRGDVADTAMTRPFDLRGVGAATLEFSLWYDIETDLDYAYVEASTDNGSTWETLEGKHTTSTNPNGTNFGHAYTGKSMGREGATQTGWLRERIDLGAYVGKEVLLRFEYITDDGYNAGGMAIDDIAIDEIGYSDDAESDMGWESAGFVRVHNALPQRYYLAAVLTKADGFDIQTVEVDREGKASFTLEGLGAGGLYKGATLVIAGMTPYTTQRAPYELNVR